MTTCARDNLKQWIDYSTEKYEIPDKLCGTTEKSLLPKGNAKGVDLFSLVTSLSQWGEPHRVYHDAEPGRSEFKFLCFLKMSYMVVPNKEKNHVITKCREQGEQQTFGTRRYTSVSIFHPQ
jgi:hypothetical protein